MMITVSNGALDFYGNFLIEFQLLKLRNGVFPSFAAINDGFYYEQFFIALKSTGRSKFFLSSNSA